MLASIELDDELCFEADEIGDVGSNGLLPAKFDSVKAPVAQRVPQLALDFRLFAPKLAGEFVRHGPLIQAGAVAMFPAQPLSHKGRGHSPR